MYLFKVFDLLKTDPFKKAAFLSVFDEPPDKRDDGKNEDFCDAAGKFCNEQVHNRASFDFMN